MMVPAELSKPIHCSPAETEYFDISQEDTVHILRILRSTLYSDKIAAVVREYSANAWDAHREAGRGDVPIQVTLPTAESLTFEVKDFGPGISHQDIARVFTKAGRSTKRESNGAVGFFGIGCKSGHAYSDTFVVISRHDGRRRTYAMVIDATGRGQSRLMDDSEGEPGDTGLTIQVPVRPGDVGRFREYAAKLYRHFSPQPTINAKLEPPLELGQHGVLVRGSSGYTTEWRPEGFQVVMGCVTYPVHLSQLQVAPFVPKMEGVLRCDIGDLDVAASREALEYSDRTKRALEAKLEALIDELVQVGLSRAKAAESAWERRLVLRECLLGIDLPILRQHLESMSKSELKLPESAALKFWYYRQQYKRESWQEATHIPVSRKARLVFRGSDRRRWKRFDLLSTDIVVTMKDGIEEAAARDALRDILGSLGATGIPTVEISALPYHKVSGGRRGSPLHSPKHQIFEIDPERKHLTPRAETWRPVQREPTRADAYVLLDAWNVQETDFFLFMQADREVLAAAGVQMPNVYGYRGAAKQKPVGTPYGKWRERTYRKLLKSNSYIRELRDDEAWRNYWSGDSTLRDLVSPKSKPGRFFARAYKAQSRMRGNYGQLVAEYLWLLERQLAPAKMWLEIQRDWPLLVAVDQLSDICKTVSSREAWADYLNRKPRGKK